MVGDRQSDAPGVVRIAFRVAVAAVAALSVLPVADWIPGEPGTNIPPPIWPMYLLWAAGLGIMAALAWGAARLLPGGRRTRGEGTSRRAVRRRRARGEPEGRSSSPWRWSSVLEDGWVPLLLLLLVPTLLYTRVTWLVFDGRPLHIDGMTQALQGHVFASGRLSVPVATDPRFFSSSLMVEHAGRAFSQFPPGFAALLAIGFRFGAGWMIPPLCGGLAVCGLYRLLRANGEPGRTAFFMAAVFALGPWFAINAASWMSHVPTVTFILLGSMALVRSMEPERTSWIHGALAGAALGFAVMIRPLEGVAFGLPATVWVGARAWRSPPVRRALVGFAGGGILAALLLMAYNQVQHGSPTLFGFELQWGPEHGLGFHEAPWGPPHTLSRGLQLMNGYLLGLQLLYFDAPAPSVVLAFAALLLVRRLDALDRYLLAGCSLVLLGYVSFWGEGHDLGPRYLIPLAPVVAIWTVRFGAVLAERTGREAPRRWGPILVGLLLASGWIFGTPTRWFVYSRSDPLRRVDTGVLGTPRARDAVVFVPSPWSIQVQARLRSTGMSRQQAEWFYYHVGLCKLDVALAQLENRGVQEPDSVVAALRPLAADSASMVIDRLAGTPGDPYNGLDENADAARTLCGLRQSLERAQGGYMLLPFTARIGPTWTGDGAIVAHDLHEEDRRLLAEHPDREAYFLKAVRIRGRVREFALEPLDPDSVARVWGRFEELEREASVF